jgi:hypothetical protein
LNDVRFGHNFRISRSPPYEAKRVISSRVRRGKWPPIEKTGAKAFAKLGPRQQNQHGPT